MGMRSLTEVTIAKRYREGLKLVRDYPEEGALILSHILWPEGAPSLQEIDRIVRSQQRRCKQQLQDDLLKGAA